MVTKTFWECEKCEREFKTKKKCLAHEKTCKGKKTITHSKKDNKENIIFFSIIGAVLIVALILLAPTETFVYEVEVPYTTTETYTETEPYQTEEAYTVKEPYETTETYVDQVPMEESVPYTDYETVVHNAPFGEYYSSCGTDCVCTYTSFWTGGCTQCTCLVAVTRYRTEIVYEEVEKERPVTKYRDVTKYRTVTKYRDVDKTRDVMKTRMEEREMEVNWLFGFKTPYKIHLF
ncbi:hypothetical protein HQ533_06030 [Candidatus Woesearchaeota archaeon]|nr:hypothetical protein [Candidatus Woesearchaeota archaeon]